MGNSSRNVSNRGNGSQQARASRLRQTTAKIENILARHGVTLHSTASRHIAIQEDLQDQMLVREIEGLLYRRTKIITIVAVCTVLWGVLINELCAGGDYSETPPSEDEQREMQLRWETNDSRTCNSAGLTLKVILTCVTLVLLALLVLQFRLRIILHTTKELLARQKRMKHLFVFQEPQWWSHITSAELCQLLVELLICSLHPLPGYHKDYRVGVLGNTYYYRFESIMCAAMLPRLYHLARWLQQATLYRYFELEQTYTLRDSQTIEMLRESVVSPKRLTLKVAMSRHPFRIIGGTVALLIVTLSYLVRIAEGPAHTQHSSYFWEQMWVVITQGTTGYGKTSPETHLGRFAAVLVMGMGPLIVAFVTASTTKSLVLDHDEEIMMRQIDANRLTARVLDAAARIIQVWWRHATSRGGRAESAPKRIRGALSRAGSVWTDVRGRMTDRAPERKQLDVDLFRSFYDALEDLRKFKQRFRMQLNIWHKSDDDHAHNDHPHKPPSLSASSPRLSRDPAMGTPSLSAARKPVGGGRFLDDADDKDAAGIPLSGRQPPRSLVTLPTTDSEGRERATEEDVRGLRAHMDDRFERLEEMLEQTARAEQVWHVQSSMTREQQAARADVDHRLDTLTAAIEALSAKLHTTRLHDHIHTPHQQHQEKHQQEQHHQQQHQQRHATTAASGVRGDTPVREMAAPERGVDRQSLSDILDDRELQHAPQRTRLEQDLFISSKGTSPREASRRTSVTWDDRAGPDPHDISTSRDRDGSGVYGESRGAYDDRRGLHNDGGRGLNEDEWCGVTEVSSATLSKKYRSVPSRQPDAESQSGRNPLASSPSRSRPTQPPRRHPPHPSQTSETVVLPMTSPERDDPHRQDRPSSGLAPTSAIQTIAAAQPPVAFDHEIGIYPASYPPPLRLPPPMVPAPKEHPTLHWSPSPPLPPLDSGPRPPHNSRVDHDQTPGAEHWHGARQSRSHDSVSPDPSSSSRSAALWGAQTSWEARPLPAKRHGREREGTVSPPRAASHGTQEKVQHLLFQRRNGQRQQLAPPRADLSAKYEREFGGAGDLSRRRGMIDAQASEEEGEEDGAGAMGVGRRVRQVTVDLQHAATAHHSTAAAGAAGVPGMAGATGSTRAPGRPPFAVPQAARLRGDDSRASPRFTPHADLVLAPPTPRDVTRRNGLPIAPYTPRDQSERRRMVFRHRSPREPTPRMTEPGAIGRGRGRSESRASESVDR